MDDPLQQSIAVEQKNAKYKYISLLFVIVFVGVLFTIASSMYAERKKQNVVAELDVQNKSSDEKAQVLEGTYDTDDLVIRSADSRVARAIFKIEIADTPALQQLGLSGRADLAAGDALLFPFPKDAYYPFWMKDMNFPIDIIWINKDKKIVHIVEHASPASYPQTFQSPVLARYVLEVRDGIVKEKGIKVGDKAEF